MSNVVSIRSLSETGASRAAVTGDVLAKWQSVVNLLSEIVLASSVVILGKQGSHARVLVASQTSGNPYKEGDLLKLQPATPGFEIISQRRPLRIVDAAREAPWRQARESLRGMLSCMGEPLLWPDGGVFGALWAMDCRERTFTKTQQNTLAHFKHLIDLQLQLLAETEVRRTARRSADGRRRVKLNDQLEQAQKMELLGCLATGIAHDFNNLIMVILHSTQRLSRMLGPDAQLRETLSTIEQAAHQANDVTRSLLSISRDVPISREPVRLCAAVEESARLLKRTLPESIRLVVSRALQPPLWISANNTHLQQILLNLAMNARDAMPDGGTLRVTAAPATAEDLADWNSPPSSVDSYACLTVVDTGVGIPPEIQSRVFEPFFTTKPPGLGTGLGLASVQAMVQRHRGHIVLQSEPGEGTTFRLLFPRIRPQSMAEAAPTVESGGGSGRTILLVAADPHLRGIVAMTLESLSYDVIHAGDGRAATQRLAQCGDSIHGLVVDADLAEGRGLDWLASTRQDGCCLPAILIGGESPTETPDRVPSHTRLIKKPFNANELGRLLGDLLTGKRPREN